MLNNIKWFLKGIKFTYDVVILMTAISLAKERPEYNKPKNSCQIFKEKNKK